MRARLIAIALLVAACSSSSIPRYEKTVSDAPNGIVVMRLESVDNMSAPAMRKALLAEAARLAIDRGQIYVRVDEISTDSAVDVRQSVTKEPIGGDPAPTGNRIPAQSSQVSFSRHRTGSIRFEVAREKPASGEVYDAARLLDDINAGKER